MSDKISHKKFIGGVVDRISQKKYLCYECSYSDNRSEIQGNLLRVRMTN